MIKKISGDAGHNCYPDIGYKNESELTKELWGKIKVQLEYEDIEVIDYTPYEIQFSKVKGSINYRIEKINNILTDLHLSIHFNKGIEDGITCIVKDMNSREVAIAERICKRIEMLGYKNNGVKACNLLILNESKRPVIIINCASIDSKEDMDRYDSSLFAKAVVNAITSDVLNYEEKINKDNKIVNNIENIKTNEPINIKKKVVLDFNARVINEKIKVKDSRGRETNDFIEKGEEIKVLNILYGLQLAFIKYIRHNEILSGYIENTIGNLEFIYNNQWRGRFKREVIFEDAYCTKVIGKLGPREVATPLYMKNGVINIAYKGKKGYNTRNGYVKYLGGFDKF